jgi:protein-tyrosine phosphatase
VTEQDRHIDLDGVGNFRDIGGYQTAGGRRLRWRQVFRSAQPDGIEAHEAQRLAEEFGVSTLIDLRHPTEGNAQVGAAPAPLAAVGVDYRNHSLQDSDRPYSELITEMREFRPERAGQAGRSAELYLEFFISRRPDELAAVFETIAETEGAPVIYCTAGKDRTGVTIALLLSMLGVPDGTIADDYDLSNLASERLEDWSRRNGGRVDEMTPERRRALFGVRRDGITQFLTLFRAQFGDVRPFLQAQGVATRSLDRIETRLLG